MKIIGISGSLRQGSLNTALLQVASTLLPDNIEYEETSINLPLHTGNEDMHELPNVVISLRDSVANADALIITCPEYNWNMTSAMKNAIDWLSLGGSQSPLNDHVAMIAGVGGGRLGSVRAQMSVRSTLLHNRVWVVPGPEVLIAPREDLFDSEGNLTDEFAVGLLQQNIDELIRVAPTLRKK
jgi:chromate reductase